MVGADSAIAVEVKKEILNSTEGSDCVSAEI